MHRGAGDAAHDVGVDLGAVQLIVAAVPAECHPAVVVAQPSAGPVLTVDHEHAGRSYRNVVQVRRRRRALVPIVQHHPAGAVQDVEQLRDAALPDVALLDPRRGRQPALTPSRVPVRRCPQPRRSLLTRLRRHPQPVDRRRQRLERAAYCDPTSTAAALIAAADTAMYRTKHR